MDIASRGPIYACGWLSSWRLMISCYRPINTIAFELVCTNFEAALFTLFFNSNVTLALYFTYFLAVLVVVVFFSGLSSYMSACGVDAINGTDSNTWLLHWEILTETNNNYYWTKRVVCCSVFLPFFSLLFFSKLLVCCCFIGVVIVVFFHSLHINANRNGLKPTKPTAAQCI